MRCYVTIQKTVNRKFRGSKTYKNLQNLIYTYIYFLALLQISNFLTLRRVAQKDLDSSNLAIDSDAAKNLNFMQSTLIILFFKS